VSFTRPALAALVSAMILAATEAVAGYPRPSSAALAFFVWAGVVYFPAALLGALVGFLLSPARGLDLWLSFLIGALRLVPNLATASELQDWASLIAVPVALVLIWGLARWAEPRTGSPPFLFALTVGVVLPILGSRFAPAVLAPRLCGADRARLFGVLAGLLAFALLRGFVARWPKAGGVFLLGPVISVALWNRGTMSALPVPLPASGASHPDIVLIVLDTVRARSLPPYGHDRSTMPRLIDFAGQATTFTRVWTNGSWTLPAHASLFSGLRLGRHRYDSGFAAHDRASPDLFLAERLRRAGYTTAASGANFGVFGRGEPLLRGFEQVDIEPLRPFAFRPWFFEIIARFPRGLLRPLAARFPGPSMRAPWVVDKALKFWRRPEDRPRFLFVNLMEAHLPWIPDPKDLGRFGPVGLSLEKEQTEVLGRYLKQGRPTSEEAALLRARYHEALYTMDQSLDNLLRDITAGPRGANTVVVITSDHGESLGEHDRFGHRTSLDEEVGRIPLFIRGPGLKPGSISEALVESADVFGYLAGVAGLKVESGLDALPLGERREVVMEHRPGPQGALPASYPRGDLSALVDWPYKYIEGGGAGRLFDLSIDQGEAEDLAMKQPTRADAMGRRLAKIASVRSATDAPADRGIEERLRALGYVR